MKKALYFINLLILVAAGLQASEPQNLTPEEQEELAQAIQLSLNQEQAKTPPLSFEDLPDFVLLLEILPKLADKDLVTVALINKKMHYVAATELNRKRKLRQYLENLSAEYRDKLIESEEARNTLLEQDAELKKIGQSSGDVLHYAEIVHRLMLKQRDQFKEQLPYDSSIKLGLRDNHLAIIYPGVFDAPEFKNLKELTLHNTKLATFYNTKLATLPEGIFNKLKNLEELFLPGNQLTTLPEGIFNKLKNLKRLYLHSNHLFTLPEGIFNELENLEWLRLDYNHLFTLPEGIFNKLENLKMLFLDGNRLATLPEKTLDRLKNLVMLDVRYNILSKETIKKLQKAQKAKRYTIDY